MINTGIVADINDPKNLNRIKVRLHGFKSDGNTTSWVHMCSPFAGPEYGFSFLPQVGDEVILLLSENHNWLCIGSIWSLRHLPPQESSADTRVIKTPAGHLLSFNDYGDIELKHATGNSIVLSKDGDISIKIADTNTINIGGKGVEASLLGETFQDRFNDFVDKFNNHNHSYIKPLHASGSGSTGNSSEQANNSDSNDLSKKVVIE